ncbi:bifunctional 2-polyprenyl-6-hydroxyphenol methylase/3-demethylubiquinol 3-O-methyltransferase UbiG [Frankia sp. CiP3]|uniref:class I SAM-dependent methyltransferase n=1 Tax=Frankia sp. CiP3 TaxID=2880971 RepID=UPI001EF4DECC|nr:class I SAM-dependent methyltransferase [Frankia sp. CiP3]
MTTRQTHLRDSGERVVPEWVNPNDRMVKMLLDQHLRRYRTAALAVADKRVLDYGCGVGYGARMLAEAGAASVTAVDVDPAALAYARTHYPAAAIDHVLADTIATGTYDVITCFEVLQHVQDPAELLAAFQRVLDPHGRLYLSASTYPTADMYRYHQRDYDQAGLRAAVGAAGFTIVDEFDQASVMSANDLRRASLLHWRSFPAQRFRRHPMRVLRRLVRTHLVQGVTHEAMTVVCAPTGNV